MKTRKAVAARFKVTGTGKLKYRREGKRHLLSGKTSKRKRSLRRASIIPEGNERTYKRMMCVS